MKREAMSSAERFRAVMRFQPVDRLPRLEWAIWWYKTINRWESEGLRLPRPYHYDFADIADNTSQTDLIVEMTRGFGLDVHLQHVFFPWTAQPKPVAQGAGVLPDGNGYQAATPLADWDYHCGGILSDEKGYEELLPHFYPSNEWHQWVWDRLARWQANTERDDTLMWFTVLGFFAWPRMLFGIEKHYYAFYDYPELMHRMNHDEAEFIVRILHKISQVSRPVFATIGEDMSFNGGPMLSRELFDEFVAPYYRRIVPVMKDLGLIVFVDSDGNANELVSWLADVGVEGLLPMERNAGSDAAATRKKRPKFLMLGNFEKLLMTGGEAAMRQEFERLLPIMRQGGFIPSPDHQTPPEVSLEQYRTYLRLLQEYTITGAPS
jgi:hypothetical protein